MEAKTTYWMRIEEKIESEQNQNSEEITGNKIPNSKYDGW